MTNVHCNYCHICSVYWYRTLSVCISLVAAVCLFFAHSFNNFNFFYVYESKYIELFLYETRKFYRFLNIIKIKAYDFTVCNKTNRVILRCGIFK